MKQPFVNAHYATGNARIRIPPCSPPVTRQIHDSKLDTVKTTTPAPALSSFRVSCSRFLECGSRPRPASNTTPSCPSIKSLLYSQHSPLSTERTNARPPRYVRTRRRDNPQTALGVTWFAIRLVRCSTRLRAGELGIAYENNVIGATAPRTCSSKSYAEPRKSGREVTSPARAVRLTCGVCAAKTVLPVLGVPWIGGTPRGPLRA